MEWSGFALHIAVDWASTDMNEWICRMSATVRTLHKSGGCSGPSNYMASGIDVRAIPLKNYGVPVAWLMRICQIRRFDSALEYIQPEERKRIAGLDSALMQLHSLAGVLDSVIILVAMLLVHRNNSTHLC